MDAPIACPTVSLLGLDFADIDAIGAAAVIAERPDGAPFRYVVTPNADHLVRLERQPELMTIYRDALLRLMDSRIVARAAQVLGLSTPSVATGSDVAARLLGYHVRPGERVTIVGLRPEFVPMLVDRCGIAPPAHHDPAMGFARNPAALQEAVAFVVANPARLVFLALGSPGQEILAAAIQATGQAVGTGLCAGASLDFLAGAAQRAPLLMQRAGLEWLHRMANDPGRLARRYLHDDPPVFGMLMRERLAQWGLATPEKPIRD
jgi:N-acetylglucosaminyldiphosphoundecaprenol N-acetyl-beta-D-mannosaminyltransferase